MVARFVFFFGNAHAFEQNKLYSFKCKQNTNQNEDKNGILNTYSKSWNFVRATKSLFAYFINRSKADDGRDNTVCDKTLFVSFFFLLLKSICEHVRNGKLNANRIKFIKSWRQNQTFLSFDQAQQRDADSYMNLICHSYFILSIIKEYVITTRLWEREKMGAWKSGALNEIESFDFLVEYRIVYAYCEYKSMNSIIATTSNFMI